LLSWIFQSSSLQSVIRVVQANFSLLELLAHEHKNIDLMLNEDLGAIALVEWYGGVILAVFDRV